LASRIGVLQPEVAAACNFTKLPIVNPCEPWQSQIGIPPKNNPTLPPANQKADKPIIPAIFANLLYSP